MGVTRIPWADFTFNPFIGCTRIDTQCENCYAELQNSYRKWNGGTWGPGAPRKVTSDTYWQQPFKWDRLAAANRTRYRVFSASLADIFDAESPLWPELRSLPGPETAYLNEPTLAVDVFFHEVVAKTPNLDWLILTKRFSRAAVYLAELWGDRPWGNIWVIFSAGTQKRLIEAGQELAKIDAVVRGISAEPLLEEISIWQLPLGLDWLIVGGESGSDRMMEEAWVRSLRDEAARLGTAVFVKQMGSAWARRQGLKGKADDLAEWPEDLRGQEFPVSASVLAGLAKR